MGIGLLWSCAAMVSVATLEYIRSKITIRKGLSEKPQAMAHISALWIPSYCISSGLASAFCGIGQAEFFYTELPKTMSSVAANLQSLGAPARSVEASFITSTQSTMSLKEKKGESWISSNINKGHYDYYYWLLAAALNDVNFFLFSSLQQGIWPLPR
ncbi:hypothetical protein V6N13_098119 [Hibiscus sabdariffa]